MKMDGLYTCGFGHLWLIAGCLAPSITELELARHLCLAVGNNRCSSLLDSRIGEMNE